MMRKEKEHADIHERANQHRHRQRGQGLAAAWAWLKLAPRLPVLLEASTATCARLPPPALPSAGPSGALSVPLLCAACTCGLALTAFSSAYRGRAYLGSVLALA